MPSAKVKSCKLNWSASSFVRATVHGQKTEIARNLAVSFPKPRGRPPAAKNKKPKQVVESDTESDASVLEALAAFLDKGFELPESDESDEENQNEAKTSSFNAEISRLSCSVASSSKYTDASGEKSQGPMERSNDFETQNPEDIQNQQQLDMKRTQKLESAISVHAVREAVDAISTQNAGKVPIEQINSAMNTAKSVYGGMLSPEEEAEEGILAIACGTVPTETVEQPGADSNLQRWANEFGKTTSAFEVCQSAPLGFFSDECMSGDLDRCISLVHFMEPITNAEGTEGVASIVQFVHWDLPTRFWGRRLRIERGRFVWKPPARAVDGKSNDDLSQLFNDGWGRIIIRDVGATLVKARSQYRTAVPDHVLSVYNTLLTCCTDSDESDDSEYGACFVCKDMVKYRCPTCNLWSHDSCLFRVACSSSLQSSQSAFAGHEDENACEKQELPLQIAQHVAQVYLSTANDLGGCKLGSLAAFECCEQSECAKLKGRIGPLIDSCCLLCRGAYDRYRDGSLVSA